MKRTIILLLAAILFISVTACAEQQNGGSEKNDPENKNETNTYTQENQTDGEEPIGELKSAVVFFDFSNGSPEENIVSEEYFSYSESITPQELADALSLISGLDFNVTLSTAPDGRLVADWAADSTLITGLDDREQKEGFVFHDADSLRWFMMDSLWLTLESCEIYFTVDGGNELKFDELYPVNSFPSDLPYMGSAFYFAHSDVAGDSEDMDDEANISSEDALDILSGAIVMAEGTIILFYGEDVIDGIPCWTFAYGTDSPEKFTAEKHYAVSKADGTIYFMNILNEGKYEEYK